MAENNSKELLELEGKPRGVSSASTLESKLYVCKKDRSFPDFGFPLKKPTMSPLPKSQVIGKVKDFLGVLLESNKKLIEEAKDLMLGIADLHTPEAVAAAESAMVGHQRPAHLAESSSGSEDEDSSSNETEEDEAHEQDTDAASESLKPGLEDAERDSSCPASKRQKPKKRPKIVVLS